MKKILSLQTGADFGGTELMTYHKNKLLNRKKFNVDICFLNSHGPVSDMYRASKFEKIYHLNSNFIISIIKLFNLLSKNKYDIIHTSGLRISLLCRIITIVFPKIKIIHSQNSVDTWRKYYHVFLDRITSFRIALYLCNSYAAKEKLIQRERIPAEKIRVIHNGIDLEKFSNVSSSFSKEINSDGKIIISCIANLRKAKNHKFLIEVCRELLNMKKDFILIFVGEGDLRSELEKKIKFHNLENHILLLGSRNDIPEILAATDIFILGSLWEGLPGSILEAMASSVPVVSTNVGGANEIITDGDNGFLCASGDRIEMSSKILKLLEDENLRNVIGQNARLHVEKNFSLTTKSC